EPRAADQKSNVVEGRIGLLSRWESTAVEHKKRRQIRLKDEEHARHQQREQRGAADGRCSATRFLRKRGNRVKAEKAQSGHRKCAEDHARAHLARLEEWCEREMRSGDAV